MIASALLAAGLTGVFGAAARDVSGLFDRTAQRQLVKAALEQVLQIEVSRSAEGSAGAPAWFEGPFSPGRRSVV